MRFTRLLVASLVLSSVAACSSCNESPQPQPAVVTADAGTVTTTSIDAGAPAAQNDPSKAPSNERPFDYPVVDDAPSWAWPLVQVIEKDGKQQLQVVGWSKNITNPQLAMSVAQAKARANLVAALKERSLTQPGQTEGLIENAVFSRTFRSKSGAIFSAINVDLP